MKNLIVIVILIVFIGAILSIIIYSSLISNQSSDIHSCDEFKKNINNLIDGANYCITDKDCTLAYFDCPFGCGSYINKNANLALIKEKINLYRERCGRCEYYCIRPLNPVCNSSGVLKHSSYAT